MRTRIEKKWIADTKLSRALYKDKILAVKSGQIQIEYEVVDDSGILTMQKIQEAINSMRAYSAVSPDTIIMSPKSYNDLLNLTTGTPKTVLGLNIEESIFVEDDKVFFKRSKY